MFWVSVQIVQFIAYFKPSTRKYAFLSLFSVFDAIRIPRYFPAVSFALLCFAVVQLLKALRYKLVGRGFESQWGDWNFLLA
jgi:flagellar biosynthesis protein FliR